MKLIMQGAEASLFTSTNEFGKTLLKQRNLKNYRNEKLDEKIRVERTKSECLNIERARQAGLKVPLIYSVDKKKGLIEMQFIEGSQLKEMLFQGKKIELLNEVGKEIALMHSNNIAHNDITTSNMLIHNNQIFFVDFGLASITSSIEDFAVDLLVFKKNFLASHSRIAEKWPLILENYEKSFVQGKKVVAQLKKIEARARYL